jgi:hypothetical protein
LYLDVEPDFGWEDSLSPKLRELTRRDKIDKSKIESGTSDDVAS